jgi:hypothetical protein
MEDLLEQIKSDLRCLFPSGNILLLRGCDNFCDEYFFSVFHANKRLGYLKLQFHEDGFVELQLFKDGCYQVTKGIFGFEWFVSDKYKKPENYQEIETFLAGIWNIFI